MIITKKYNIINNELQEVDNKENTYDAEVSVYCTLNIYTGEPPCINNCKKCKYAKFKEIFTKVELREVPLIILFDLTKIKNYMLVDLSLEKDYFIDNQIIRSRMEEINICLDSIMNHGYIKTIDKEKYGKIYSILKKLTEDSKILHDTYFKYRKTNNDDYSVIYNKLKETLLEYVDDSISFLSKEREKALKYNTKVAIEKIRKGEFLTNE